MFDFLSQKFSSIFSRLKTQTRLTDDGIKEVLEKVHDALLEADVPYGIVQDFIEEVKKEVVGKKLTHSLNASEMLLKIVHGKLLSFMTGSTSDGAFSFHMPSVVMVEGLQGSGKTTTIAKLASTLKVQAEARGKTRRILLASVDFYRPAAIDQLEVLAKKAGVLFYRSPLTNPVEAAQDIVKKFHAEQCDILFLDTAGRLHVDETMLEELKKIDARIKPKYKILVIDAMTGQESLKVAQVFDEKVGFMGAILTKMDSDTRGGAAFAFRYALKKPILYVATGEKLDDIEAFKPDRMVSRIMGMGDLQTLLEKADEKIKKSEQEALTSSFARGRISLEDFAKQIDMVGKLGSLSNLMQYLPGMGSLKMTPEMLEKGEKEMKRFRAIIRSMTPKERVQTKLLDASRKGRIARGAGVSVADVNTLLARFEESQKFVKLFKSMGK
ncbi:signal recognition particle protein [Candidatus Dependentiae bacterium]|nr:signal recognition particle protein [Candidatus Dependentiae bacterium]